MRYYEVQPGLAMRLIKQLSDPSSPFPLTRSNYNQWVDLMAACRELTSEEIAYLEQFRNFRFEAISVGDILEVIDSSDGPPLHLFSPLLCEELMRQGLSANLRFIPVRLTHEGVDLPFVAVRYEPPLYVPCLRPLLYYRGVGLGYREILDRFGIDWTRCGHIVYRRRNALLVLDKSQVGERAFFRVLNEQDAPLVVREDIIEQWWEKGIEDFDLENVILE